MPQKRKSPLGYDELEATAIPSNIGGVTRKDLADNIYTAYNPANFNDPDIQGHERIHQGQFADGGNPTPQQLFDALRPMMSKDQFLQYLTSQNPQGNVHEPPAYAFAKRAESPTSKYSALGAKVATQSRADQQDAYNKYIDLMSKLTGGKAQSIQASSPKDLQQGYANHPQPVLAPQVTMKQEDISALLQRILGGK